MFDSTACRSEHHDLCELPGCGCGCHPIPTNYEEADRG